MILITATTILFALGDVAATGRPRQQVVVTRDDPSLPPRCRPQRLATLVLDFFTALRQANGSRLERFFGPGFKWFSVTGSPVPRHKRHFVARQPESAIAYVTRHRGFSLVLSELEVDAAPRRHSDIAYNGVWLRRGVRWLFVGKGATSCSSPVVKVWSMAVREERVERGPPLCPPPGEAPAPDTVVACVRQ